MRPYTLSSTNRDSSLSQFVVIERYPKGVLAQIVCPSVCQREAPIIAAEIGEALKDIDLPRGSSLVVDFSAVTMLSSMGLGMCVDIRRRADEARLKPHMFGTSRTLLDLFRMMKIDRLFTVVHGRDDLGSILG